MRAQALYLPSRLRTSAGNISIPMTYINPTYLYLQPLPAPLMPHKDPSLSPIELIEEGPDWQIWEHSDTRKRVVFSRIIITSILTSPRVTVLAQDDEASALADEYIPAIIDGLDLCGSDWYLDLFHTRPVGTWCAEGERQENILRLK